MDFKKEAVKEKTVVTPTKPSSTATPERIAAAKAANTAKKPVAIPPGPGVPGTEKKPVEEKVTEKKVVEEKPKVTEKKVAEPPDFKGMVATGATVTNFVEAYNEMVQTAIDLGIKKVGVVKTFVDVNTGMLACERLHSAITKTREPKENTDMTKKTAKKTSTKKTKTAKKTTGGAKRAKLEDTGKIKWIAGAKNPFREKSGKWTRVEKVKALSGSTVKEYLKKGGKTGTLRYCIKAKLVSVA